MDQFSGGVDFLMDENILTNDSREEEEGMVSRTPHNIKNMSSSASISPLNMSSTIYYKQIVEGKYELWQPYIASREKLV